MSAFRLLIISVVLAITSCAFAGGFIHDAYSIPQSNKFDEINIKPIAEHYFSKGLEKKHVLKKIKSEGLIVRGEQHLINAGCEECGDLVIHAVSKSSRWQVTPNRSSITVKIVLRSGFVVSSDGWVIYF